MNVKFTDHNDTPERQDLIKKVLPAQTIIETLLEPAIEHRLFDIIAQCVRQELDIYRAYPKKAAFAGEEEESPEEMVETFDPRNNETCYMGKGFKSNSEVTDYELAKYRQAIGTIPHPIWGRCTLLEIWGGDHFEDYNDMVVGAFKYGMGMQDQCPEITVHINPLFQNKKSKTFKLSPAQQQYKDDMDDLLAKAMVFGVRTPEQARRARRR